MTSSQDVNNCTMSSWDVSNTSWDVSSVQYPLKMFITYDVRDVSGTMGETVQSETARGPVSWYLIIESWVSLLSSKISLWRDHRCPCCQKRLKRLAVQWNWTCEQADVIGLSIPKDRTRHNFSYFSSSDHELDRFNISTMCDNLNTV